MTTSSFTQRVREWLWHEPSQRVGTPREPRAGDVYRAYAFPGPGGIADLILPALMEVRAARRVSESYVPVPQRRVERRAPPVGTTYEIGLQVARPCASP